MQIGRNATLLQAYILHKELVYLNNNYNKLKLEKVNCS